MAALQIIGVEQTEGIRRQEDVGLPPVTGATFETAHLRAWCDNFRAITGARKLERATGIEPV